MGSSGILLENTAGLATLTLNRPEKSNAFDDAMIDALLAALQSCERDGVRCLVITGAGRNFCAGQDLAAFMHRYESPGGVSFREHLIVGYNRIVQSLKSLEIPVIAAVNGAAAGAGLGLACASDLRFGSESSKFRTAFIGIGLAPDSATSFHLPRLIGYGRAMEMALTNQLIDSATALRYGLLNQVFPDAELMPRTLEIAGALAKGPTKAMGFTKQAFQHSLSADLASALDNEARLQDLAGATADHREGVKAFLEKRAPKYKGE
jgi:2-(1,2-epoxy-1,2-dihydrophenyl)acetyl-CoA isomerase